MSMLHNVGVNTESRRTSDGQCARTPSIKLKLKERNVKHTRINNIKDLNDIFIYGEMLGRGVFGTVVEVTDKTTKKVWALKIVDKKIMKGSKINTIENEIKILRMVSHPHIIYLQQIFESNRNIYLVLERCTKELADILKMKKKFSEPEARRVMDHLANAIAYLHKYDIIHRDLKMENILTAPNPTDPNDELYIKVSDFGLSTVKSCSKPDQMMSDRCGTLTYMAPEIISRASYSQQCDVWAMGVICYLLLVGYFPFYHKNEAVLEELICSHEPNYKEFMASTPEAVHLIKKMLDKNPALRISAIEVCRHPWIRGSSISNTTPNVLDMMQLWRSEMMVEPEADNGSDWAEAFSSLQCTENSTPQVSIPDVSASKSQQTTKNVKEQKQGKSQKTTSKPSQGIQVDEKIVVLNENMRKTRNFEGQTSINDRALSIKGKNTKLIRIGK